jgi:hypothetical protein
MPRNLSEQFAFVRNLTDCYSFSQRVNYNFTVYHSKMYTRCKKSCDYIVRYRTGSSHENFGAIKEFFECDAEIDANIYNFDISTFDLFENMNIKNRDFSKDFSFEKLYYVIIKQSLEESVINMSAIVNKCIILTVNNKTYLTDFLYDREHD